MERISKSKSGFSLLEMVLVVGIIVILAAVLVINIGTYIQTSKNASSQADASRRATNDNIMSAEASMVALGFGKIKSSAASPADT